jgi:hypothetical protein
MAVRYCGEMNRGWRDLAALELELEPRGVAKPAAAALAASAVLPPRAPPPLRARLGGGVC